MTSAKTDIYCMNIVTFFTACGSRIQQPVSIHACNLFITLCLTFQVSYNQSWESYFMKVIRILHITSYSHQKSNLEVILFKK